jgi:hypothetical protein
MKLTCKCGAELEMSDDVVSMPYRMDKFLATHACCLQPEVHNHLHFNPDNAFWLNTFASQAMQGILASCHEENKNLPTKERCAALSVDYAKALLERLKEDNS